MQRAQEIGVGSGTFSAEDRRRIVREWQADAGGDGPRLSTRDEAILAAAAMGFQVVTDG